MPNRTVGVKVASLVCSRLESNVSSQYRTFPFLSILSMGSSWVGRSGSSLEATGAVASGAGMDNIFC